jgi:hypothetical protein
MKLHWIVAFFATLMAAGCSARGTSGTYVRRGQGFVEMLQITQAQDGQLLGSLSSTALNLDGSITQGTTNIAGVADGHAVTLVAKSPIPLFPGLNMPGTIESGVITITNPNGQERFSSGSPGYYETAVQQLQAQGSAIQEQKRRADEDASVAILNKKLADYAAMVQSPQATQQVAMFHAAHVKALERARHSWEMEQRHPKGSLQSGQVYLAVNQVSLDLSTYDLDWQALPDQGRSHLKAFDKAIAQSPCAHGYTELTACAEQRTAIHAYQVARPVVEARMADAEATLKNDAAAMKAIVDQAQAYSIK